MARLPGGYVAIGFSRGSEIVGAVIFTDWRPVPGGGSIHIWAAGHNWISRRTLKAIFDYPFNQLGCHRVHTFIAKQNRTSRKLAEGVGFKFEGVGRKLINTHLDAMIYSILKDECRWI